VSVERNRLAGLGHNSERMLVAWRGQASEREAIMNWEAAAFVFGFSSSLAFLIATWCLARKVTFAQF
jgi:hypothetical protein